MARSEASKEKRRAYAREYSRKNRDYFRQWSRDHRQQELDRKARYRALNRDLVRAAWKLYYETHRVPRKQVEPVPSLFQGHEFFETAKFICGEERKSWATLTDCVWEEMMAEAVLALVEGRDPEAAARQARSREYGWRQAIAQINPGYDIYRGRFIPI